MEEKETKFKLKILVCGSCLPSEFEYRIKDLAAASNQYHLNMEKALRDLGEVKVLSYIGMNLNGVSENEINIKASEHGIKCIFKKKNPLKAYLLYQKLLRRYVEWADVIITYNIQYVWFGIGNIAKRRGKKAVLVWADHTPARERKKIGAKVYGFLCEQNAKKYQKIVALSPNLKKYLCDDQEYVISHGCVDWEQFKNFELKAENDIPIFMFSGLLEPVTGIDLLLKSMKYVSNKKIRIIITGKGSIDVSDYTLKDDRIEYRGFVSRDEYLELLQEADVLVNPRNMNLPENQNNFPSKVLEYLATGKIIISTRFPGYEKFTNNGIFVDSDPESIGKAINMISLQIKNCREEYYISNRNVALMHTWEKAITNFI